MIDIAARQAVIDAVFARLGEIDDIAELDINPSGEPSRFRALYLVEEDQDANDMTEPEATRYTLSLTIEGYVQGGGGPAATAARSALYLDVVAALMGEPLHELVEEIHEGRMRLATTVLAKERRLGFALGIKIIFPATSILPIA